MSGVSTVDETTREIFFDEFKDDYERTDSELERMCDTDAIVKADTANWDVVDPTDEAEEKGRDGKIKVSKLGLGRVSAPIKQKYKKHEIDSLDEFTKNPNIRSKQVQKEIIACNKSKDRLIYNTLKTAPQLYNDGTAVVLNDFGRIADMADSLWSDDIPNDGNVFGIITTRAEAQMMKIQEFKNADYVDVQPVKEGAGTKRFRHFMGVNWATWTGIDGRGSATAECMFFHKTAIGHMTDGTPMTHIGWDDQDDFYFSWARIRHAATVCLPRGIRRFRHDDTAALL